MCGRERKRERGGGGMRVRVCLRAVEDERACEKCVCVNVMEEEG